MTWRRFAIEHLEKAAARSPLSYIVNQSERTVKIVIGQ